MAIEPVKAPGMVEFASCGGNVAVIRLVGRCSFQNSASLQKAAEICERQIGSCTFVVDFDQCESMDSTFLGVLAGIALHQRQQGLNDLIAVNVSERLYRSMSLLGLTHILEIRERRPAMSPLQEVEIGEQDKIKMTRAEQVAHMIQAHRRLIELDGGNEVRFENVLKYLDESLKRARSAKREQTPAPREADPS